MHEPSSTTRHQNWWAVNHVMHVQSAVGVRSRYAIGVPASGCEVLSISLLDKYTSSAGVLSPLTRRPYLFRRAQISSVDSAHVIYHLSPQIWPFRVYSTSQQAHCSAAKAEHDLYKIWTACSRRGWVVTTSVSRVLRASPTLITLFVLG